MSEPSAYHRGQAIVLLFFNLGFRACNVLALSWRSSLFLFAVPDCLLIFLIGHWQRSQELRFLLVVLLQRLFLHIGWKVDGSALILAVVEMVLGHWAESCLSFVYFSVLSPSRRKADKRWLRAHRRSAWVLAVGLVCLLLGMMLVWTSARLLCAYFEILPNPAPTHTTPAARPPLVTRTVRRPLVTTPFS